MAKHLVAVYSTFCSAGQCIGTSHVVYTWCASTIYSIVDGLYDILYVYYILYTMYHILYTIYYILYTTYYIHILCTI